jgi:hypothetical protein
VNGRSDGPIRCWTWMANAAPSIGSSAPCGPAKAGFWCCAESPVWGRRALLAYQDQRMAGFRVVRAAGAQSEMELAFAGLHQLLSEMLDRLEICRRRSGTRCGPRSGSAPARCPTGS